MQFPKNLMLKIIIQNSLEFKVEEKPVKMVNYLFF